MTLNIRKHRIILIDLWKDIVASPYGKILGFKGGTLLYFLHNLDRFSTDLDFDLLSPTNEEKLLSDLAIIAQKYGKIKDMYNKENTLFLLVDYETNEMNIKIEINKRTRKNDHFSYRNIFGYQALCMDIDCLFANKLVVLTQRNRLASRDLYDIYFFLKNGFPINEGIITERTKLSLSEYLAKVALFIQKNFNKDNVLAGLGELINEKQKFFVKEKLINEVLDYLKIYT